MAKVALGIFLGGALGAVGIGIARKFLAHRVRNHPYFKARPRRGRFAEDFTIALFAAPGVIMGHAIVREGLSEGVRTGIASITK